MLSNLESHPPASAGILEPHTGSISNPWKQKTLRFFSPLKKALFKAFYPLEKPWKNLNENLNGFKGWMHSSLFKFIQVFNSDGMSQKCNQVLNKLEWTWENLNENLKSWKVECIQIHSSFFQGFNTDE